MNTTTQNKFRYDFFFNNLIDRIQKDYELTEDQFFFLKDEYSNGFYSKKHSINESN